MMEYKGYKGQVEYDDEAKLFHGRVIGISGVITFEGDSVKEIEQAFQDSIEDYLEFCSELGQDPEKPFSGKFTVRIPPELRQKAASAAQSSGKSLNAWLKDVLGKEVSRA